MIPALWGLLAALGWGGADFIARFTGRAVGHHRALLGVLAVGSLAAPLLYWLSGAPWVGGWQGAWLVVVAGLSVTVATLFLYWGVARGPVTIVSPIAASYPVFNMALAVILGLAPTPGQWSAMIAVLAGVVLVSAATRHFEGQAEYSRAALRQTVLIAIAASLGLAVAVGTIQAAAAIYGELQTLMMTRWIGFLALLGLLLARRQPVALPVRVWPLVVLQGLLDASAYLTLSVANQGADGVIAAVVGSGFGLVTVILAKLILKEPMTAWQWLGALLVVAGVAALSGLG